MFYKIINLAQKLGLKFVFRVKSFDQFIQMADQLGFSFLEARLVYKKRASTFFYAVSFLAGKEERVVRLGYLDKWLFFHEAFSRLFFLREKMAKETPNLKVGFFGGIHHKEWKK